MKKSFIAGIAAAGMFLGAYGLAGAATVDKNLSYGLRNDPEVADLQNILISQGYLSGEATGNFLSQTLSAVRSFQAANGIDQTGFVGTQTRAALGTSALEVPTQDTTFSPTPTDTPSPSTTSGPSNPTVSPRSVSITKMIAIGPPCNTFFAAQRTYKPGDRFCMAFHIENHDTSLPHGFLDDTAQTYDIVSIDTPSSSIVSLDTGNNQFNSHYNQVDTIYVMGTVNQGVAPGTYTLGNHVATKGCTKHTTLATACGGWADANLFTTITVAGADTTTTGPSVTLSASPSVITAGQTSTLTLATTNSTTCTIPNAPGGGPNTSGTVNVNPSTTTTYTATCTDSTGRSAIAQTTVTVNSAQNTNSPSLSFINNSITLPTATVGQYYSYDIPFNYTGSLGVRSGGFFPTGFSGTVTTNSSGQRVLRLSGTGVFGFSGDLGLFLLSDEGIKATGTFILNVQVSNQQTSDGTPTATLSASPSVISAGQTAKITLSTTNVTSCTGSLISAIGGYTSSGASNTVSYTVAPSQTTVYNVSCTNSAGQSTSASTQITVQQGSTDSSNITLSASPASVSYNQPTTLTWSSNASSCYIAQKAGSAYYLVAGNGTLVTPGLTAPTETFLIYCNGDQSNTKYTNISVSSQPQTTSPGSGSAPVTNLGNYITASPVGIAAGMSSTLSWWASSGLVNGVGLTCTLGTNGSNFLPVANVGTKSVSPTQTTLYTFRCTNGAAISDYKATVNVSSATSNALSAIQSLIDAIKAEISGGVSR